MHQVLAQAFNLIKSSNVGKFVQCIVLFIALVENCIVLLCNCNLTKIRSEQGQIEELGLKANVEFKI